MTGQQNKLSRFWQELKRRRVLHVITVYASAAFVIIELVGNLTEPLNLPASLSTIVIIVLAVGFPFAIVLSWLYDLTSGTFERTKPIEDIQEGIKAKIPNAWKIATYVSFVVIAGLIVLNIASRGDLIKPGMIKSMVVLPFDNYTGDEQLDYVAAGMHASLIGDIGKVSALRVIGTTSSNFIKNTAKSAPAIAEELDVDLVMEPTLTCYGDTVCILVRAIMPFPKEKQVWVAEYREDKSKILSLWNKIAKQIADEVKVELTPEEKQLLTKSILVDREAYDAYLKGSLYWDDLSRESLYKALDYLNLAVEKDPNWAPLYSGLAKVWVGIAQIGYEKPEIAGPKIFENIQKAMELDPDLSDLHYTLGLIAVWTEWDFEKGEEEFLKALKINPNDVLSRIYYSHLLVILKRYDEAIYHSQIAAELDPMNPLVLTLSAMVDYCMEENQDLLYKRALEKSKKALEIDPENFFASNGFEYASYLLGDYKNSIETFLKFNPFDSESKQVILEVFRDKDYYAAVDTMLFYMEELAANNLIRNDLMIDFYNRAGNTEKMIEWFIKAFESHDPMMPYLTGSFYGYDKIKEDPRIVSIVEKMNFPESSTETDSSY